MDDLLTRHGVPALDAPVLRRLLADWQLLADLSFADLLLVVPVDCAVEEGGQPDLDRFVVVAQIRPTTGPTAYQDDMVGAVLLASDRPQLATAFRDRRICREGDPVWRRGQAVREEALPVLDGERVVAVVARDSNLDAVRTPSRLEIAYLRTADDLARMLAVGSWPSPETDPDSPTENRVGDGLIRLDPAGSVSFASPNALSAYRRLGYLGDLVGSSLVEVTRELAGRGGAPMDDHLAVVARGRSSHSGEIEAPDAVVALRSLPLQVDGSHRGALVLVHDITELRRRERQLLSKDATIREIHHRVKNNLQTVAALLRLQARRLAVPEAREALEESMRRVSSIAIVHETLSTALEEAVEFDEVADRVLTMVAEVSGPGVTVTRRGSFGVLDAEVATPLALVLTELVQNAVEHGYGAAPATGTVTVGVGVDPAGTLEVVVADQGRGLPPGFDAAGASGLGLQIARTLVETELGGRLALGAAVGGGTTATVSIDGHAGGPGREG
jgi:two-component system, sensor histidine kinase PdtaS